MLEFLPIIHAALLKFFTYCIYYAQCFQASIKLKVIPAIMGRSLQNYIVYENAYNTSKNN